MLHSKPIFHSSDLAIRAARIVLALLVLSACSRKPEPARADLRQFDVRGIVRAIPPDDRTIEIEHEDVPEFMPSMTMPFIVRDRKARADLRPGDAISFRLNVTAEDSWIDEIKKIDAGVVRLPSPPEKTAAPRSASARLREGDSLTAFRLVDQEGKEVTPDTFRGHPVVLTFIFTRCPIPNFCPLMSQNFEQLQSAIQEGSGPLAKTKLLSISFDPEFDTPQVLKDYAASVHAEPAIWTFATGTPAEIGELTQRFAVLVQPEGGTISHSLATALIDADGRIVEIWRGNGWKADEVIEKIKTL